MALLPHDAWVLIGLHLKPRHLSKLMSTSKTVQKLVDNNTYWTRVAAHQVWTSFEGMEIGDGLDRDNVLPPIDHNLMYMLGLEHGYYWGMERFFQRIDEVLEYYSKNDSEDYMKYWTEMKFMSLEGKTRAWLKLRHEVISRTGDGMMMSMKEVAKVEIKQGIAYHDPLYNRFVCEMEDHPMPHVYKREVFRKLDVVLWGVGGKAEAPPGEPLCGCWSTVTGAICKF